MITDTTAGAKTETFNQPIEICVRSIKPNHPGHLPSASTNTEHLTSFIEAKEKNIISRTSVFRKDCRCLFGQFTVRYLSVSVLNSKNFVQ